MEQQDIINYVMKTPCNTNPAILKDMLNSLPSGSGLEPIIEWDLDRTDLPTFDIDETKYFKVGEYIEPVQPQLLCKLQTSIESFSTVTATPLDDAEESCSYLTSGEMMLVVIAKQGIYDDIEIPEDGIYFWYDGTSGESHGVTAIYDLNDLEE